VQDLARLGFVLLGLYFLVSPLAELSSQFPFVAAASEAAASEADYLRPLLWSIGAWAVFGLAPGLFLLARNRRLAASLFPEASAEPLDARSIFAALVSLLGVYLVALGLGQPVAAAVSAGLLAHLDAPFWAQYAGGAASAVLLVGFGCFPGIPRRRGSALRLALAGHLVCRCLTSGAADVRGRCRASVLAGRRRDRGRTAAGVRSVLRWGARGRS
jgi:hypothetical protein